MRSRCTLFGTLLLALVFVALGSAELKAQAPDSIGGHAVLLTVTGGTSGIFTTSGSYFFLTSATDNSAGTADLSPADGKGSFGTYIYRTSGATGTVSYDDTHDNEQFTTTLTFTTGTSGTFRTTVAQAPGASQTGTFRAYNGTAPTSFQGWTLAAQVLTGDAPFATSGSFQFLPSASDNSYQIVTPGAATQMGTYTYTVPSAPSSALVLTDSVLGPVYSETLSWDTATTGAYVITNTSSGGFQAGTFTATPPSTVTPSAGTGGTINPGTPQLVSAGGSIGFTATPDSDFVVGQWLVNGNVAQNGGTSFTATNVTANTTVQVTFLAVATISISASPGNGGTVSGGGMFTAGTQVSLTAVASAGYTFLSWTEGGTAASTAENYIFTASADRTLVANFTNSPIISSSSVATFVVGELGMLTVTARGSPASTFSATGLPSWASLNATTGVLQGTPPDASGAPFTIDLTASNGNAPDGMQTLTLNVVPTQDFGAWLPVNGMGGPTGTPFNDGVPNLLKYLFDIDPIHAMSALDRAALPMVGTDKTTTPGTTYLTLTFREYAAQTGITILLQTSTNMQTWMTANPPDVVQQVGTDSNTGDPIMEMGVIASSTKKFIRLQVSMP